MALMNIFRKKRTNDIGGEKKSYKVVLVGDSLAGKTSLIASFLSDQLSENEMSHPSKTIQVHNQMVELSLVDTPGKEEYDRIRPLSYPLINVSLICFNVDDPQSIAHIEDKWNPEIRHFIGLCTVILVACKIDLRDDPETISKLKQHDEKPINTKTGMKLASKIHADAYIECSAKTGIGVQELFTTVAQLALKRVHHVR